LRVHDIQTREAATARAWIDGIGDEGPKRKATPIIPVLVVIVVAAAGNQRRAEHNADKKSA
jgi:hypothetical protein